MTLQELLNHEDKNGERNAECKHMDEELGPEKLALQVTDSFTHTLYGDNGTATIATLENGRTAIIVCTIRGCDFEELESISPVEQLVSHEAPSLLQRVLDETLEENDEWRDAVHEAQLEYEDVTMINMLHDLSDVEYGEWMRAAQGREEDLDSDMNMFKLWLKIKNKPEKSCDGSYDVLAYEQYAEELRIVEIHDAIRRIQELSGPPGPDCVDVK